MEIPPEMENFSYVIQRVLTPDNKVIKSIYFDIKNFFELSFE